MVAERCVELHTRVQQGFIREFELAREILRPITSVNVISEHDHEIETDSLPVCLHLPGDLILFVVPGPTVSNYSKANRLRLERQLQVQCALGCLF